MTPLGLALILLAIGGYFAVMHPRTSRYPLVRRAVVIFGLVLIPATGYQAWATIRDSRVLEAHLDTYPKAVDVLQEPENAVRYRDAKGTWVYQTPDSPDEVLAFHADPKHRRDWQIAKRTDATIVFERGPQKLFVWASRQRPDLTTIVYQIDAARD